MTKTRRFPTTQHDHYQDVTDAILAELEAGVVPWRKGWDAGRCGDPFNAVTKHAYRGINRLLLALRQKRHIVSDPRWCSYRQARTQGWQVRRGETGTRIYFYRPVERRRNSSDGQGPDNDARERRFIPLLRAYTIFHASQIDGIPEYVPPGGEDMPWQRPAAVQTILDASGVKIRTGGSQACYIPSDDVILLPPALAFESASEWACTALHELGHASATAARLNRDLSGRFGSDAYAAEEVMVEWTSCMVCAALGLPVDYANNASYLDGWARRMRADKRAIFRAATEAQRIADYILGLHPDYATAHGSSPDNVDNEADRYRAHQRHRRSSLMRQQVAPAPHGSKAAHWRAKAKSTDDVKLPATSVKPV